MSKTKIRTGAIVQARNGSSRFPRKVFAGLAGKPVLWHIIDRLRRCEILDEIIIATSTRQIDAEILAYAESEGVQSFAGSEDDVQSRFLGAAAKFNLDVLVRICGDSPFIDPGMIDRLVNEMLKENGDYAEPDPATPAAYEGMEAVAINALKKSRQLGDEGPDREHVTRYIRNHSHEFKLVHPTPTESVRGEFRLSVDNQADLRFARAVYEGLYKPGEVFNTHELVEFLRERPEVKKINAHVKQKDTAAKNFHVVFYIAPGEKSRDATHFARILNEDWHCGIGFIGDLQTDEIEGLRAMGYRARLLKSNNPVKEMDRILKFWKANLVLFKNEQDRELRVALEKRGWKVALQNESPANILKARDE
jgi:spore coat polysaccharide biosynthesis protein SpsF